MEYDLVNILILMFLLTYAHRANCGPEITDDEKAAIENGLAVGSALAEALKEGAFTDALVKLGTNIAPFLGILGPLASILLLFIPGGDSEELIFMRKEFEQVNVKLDKITAEFAEVKKAIDWSTVVGSYGPYERKIRAAVENLNQIYRVQRKAREDQKANFIIQYESDFDNSVQKLYDVMVDNDHVISDNILQAVAQHTKNNKREFEQFSLGLVQILIQGIKVKVSYYALKEWATDHLVTQWETKMIKLRDTLQTVSDVVKSLYLSQMRLDTKDLILNHHGLGNQGLANKLYNFVTEKYDWRFWSVTVYDDMGGFDKHNMWQHGGTIFLHEHDKNIIIASQSKKHASSFNINNADKLLEKVEKDVTSHYCLILPDRAYAMVNSMKRISGVGNNYRPYALRLAFQYEKNLGYKGLESHASGRFIVRQMYCCILTPYCNKVVWKYFMILFG